VDTFVGCDEHMAIVNDDIALLTEILDIDHSRVNAEHEFHTLLSLAVALKRDAIVRFLIDRGANVNAEICTREFVLTESVLCVCHVAANFGNEAILNMLMVADTDFSQLDSKQRNICHYAAMNEDESVLAALIDAGCAVDEPDEDGVRPIHLASHNRNEVVLAKLIAAGCDVNASDREGVRPVCHAAENTNDKVLSMLIGAGATLEDNVVSGYALIFIAALNENEAIVEQLIRARANVHAVSVRGETACFIALSNPNIKVLELLLAAGATLPPGGTLCHKAARNRNENVMKYVLSIGADVNLCDESGFTALHDAAIRGSAAVVSMMLDAGADVCAVGKNGKMAHYYAAYNSAAGVMAALLARSPPAFDLEFIPNAVGQDNLDAVRAIFDAKIDAIDEYLRRNFAQLLRCAGQEAQRTRSSVFEFLLEKRQVDCREVMRRTLDDHELSAAATAMLFANGVLSSLSRVSQPSISEQGERMLTLIATGYRFSGPRHVRGEMAFAVERVAAFLAVVGDCDDAQERQLSQQIMRWALFRITNKQFQLLQLRGFEIAVGLQSLNLPALIVCEILSNAFAPLVSLVPFHRVWAIATIVKHFFRQE
jgi:ankyrin repeat protein